MNLRELVAKLEVEGKPHGSEEPVQILDESGQVYEVVDVEWEPTPGAEGSSGTTWIKVDPL